MSLPTLEDLVHKIGDLYVPCRALRQDGCAPRFRYSPFGYPSLEEAWLAVPHLDGPPDSMPRGIPVSQETGEPMIAGDAPPAPETGRRTMTTREFETCPRTVREWMVELWNRACPPGTPVRARPRGMEPLETRTTCPAELSFGYPVVQVEGHHGWVDLVDCLPLREKVPGPGG